MGSLEGDDAWESALETPQKYSVVLPRARMTLFLQAARPVFVEDSDG